MSLPINSRIAEDIAPTLQAAKSENRGGTDGPLVYVPSASSPESEGWTSDCTGPGSSTSCSRRLTGSGGTCCEHGSPESPSSMTFVKSQKAHDPEDCERWEEAEATNTLSPRDGTAPSTLVLANTLKSQGGRGWSYDPEATYISSAAGSPAKTSPSPDNDAASQATDPACSSSSPESQTLFDPDGFSSRTYPDCSPRMAVGTSESCLERWPTSGTAWDGGFSTHVTSECRSADGGCSSSGVSLTEILEPPASVPARYSLSARAATGILRRAEKRGRMLPGHLAAALESVAGPRTPSA